MDRHSLLQQQPSLSPGGKGSLPHHGGFGAAVRPLHYTPGKSSAIPRTLPRLAPLGIPGGNLLDSARAHQKQRGGGGGGGELISPAIPGDAAAKLQAKDETIQQLQARLAASEKVCGSCSPRMVTHFWLTASPMLPSDRAAEARDEERGRQVEGHHPAPAGRA